MSAAKTHPHIDMPSEEDLGRVIDATFPAHHDLYLDAHRLMVDTVSELRYSVDTEDAAIGYGERQFGYDGWGMAAVAPFRNWVSIGFLRGTQLDDPDGLLEGTGTLVRHVKVRSAEEFASRRASVRRLVKAAAHINDR